MGLCRGRREGECCSILMDFISAALTLNGGGVAIRAERCII